jgi:hypothetical protein
MSGRWKQVHSTGHQYCRNFSICIPAEHQIAKCEYVAMKLIINCFTEVQYFLHVLLKKMLKSAHVYV